MARRLTIAAAVLAVLAAGGNTAWAHCQIPCGIYDDPVRFSQLEEHVTTIEKSMKQIVELSGESSPNYNQLVRWVNNKETHVVTGTLVLASRIPESDDNPHRA